ncbi:MAG: hypothetical protein KC643_20895, partial [Nitrospira sp.]|nr:hypothetical protein [Nitrospira sp.]
NPATFSYRKPSDPKHQSSSPSALRILAGRPLSLDAIPHFPATNGIAYRLLFRSQIFFSTHRPKSGLALTTSRITALDFPLRLCRRPRPETNRKPKFIR